MTDRRKRIVKLILRLIVTATLLVWVFSRADLGQFGRTISAARWSFLIGTWVFVVLFSIVQSMALQIILRKQDCHVRLTTLFGATVATALYSIILPGLLSTGVKWYILKKDTGKGSHVLSSMVYNQMALFVTITAMGLVAILAVDPVRLLAVEPHQGRTMQILAAALLVTIVFLSALLLSARTGAMLMRVLNRMVRPLPQRVSLKVREMLQQIATFQSAEPVFHLKVAAINTLATLLLGIPTYVCAAWAAGISVPLGVFVFLHAGVYVLSKLPVTVANLGLREVTLVGILTGYGISSSSALLMSMILFSSHLFLAALGGGYQLFWSRETAKSATTQEPR